MTQTYNETVEKARNYYNSDDADLFYFNVWGGEDLHVGQYINETEDIFTASRRTVENMLSMLRGIGKDVRVLDIGGGYGGGARFIAKTTGAHCTVLNLSEKENERDRVMNKEQGLDHLIEVLDGSFEDIPCDDASFDIVWSQDAILHSNSRDKVVKEAFRVLKKGGEFIWTDPMRNDATENSALQPILDRIHLDTLASPETYQKQATAAGFEPINQFVDLTPCLRLHYQRVLEETEKREKELIAEVGISEEYITNMKKGLRHWVDGGDEGKLAWGIFQYRKP